MYSMFRLRHLAHNILLVNRSMRRTPMSTNVSVIDRAVLHILTRLSVNILKYLEEKYKSKIVKNAAPHAMIQYKGSPLFAS